MVEHLTSICKTPSLVSSAVRWIPARNSNDLCWVAIRDLDELKAESMVYIDAFESS